MSNSLVHTVVTLVLIGYVLTIVGSSNI